MATSHVRLPQRRGLAQRVKADENATSRHLRQGSNATIGIAARLSSKENIGGKPGQRQALGEVTTTAVNRKDMGGKSTFGKDKEEVGSKRGRSDSTTLPQRIPLGPGRSQAAPPVTHTVNARVQPAARVRAPVTIANRRLSRVAPPIVVAKEIKKVRGRDAQIAMDVEEEIAAATREAAAEEELLAQESEVEAMVDVADDSDEDEEIAQPPAKIQRVWPEVSTQKRLKYKHDIEAVHETFEDCADVLDPSMVSEYADEIFEYMNDLEVGFSQSQFSLWLLNAIVQEEMMPSPDYMNDQTEITWAMRQTLVDWLLQVHLRYHMLPETLWIAVNIVDRFLSKRVVSLVKLQLVGVTAMFIASKYEEILAPSVEEFVYMTESVYPREEILKGERIMLQTLDFRISHYCSPYSWMRKISKADDYDIHTRTLSKFLTEVTLLDYRFLRVKPSLVAAVGMYTARRMLGGTWDDAFVFYSDYTEEQLIPGHELLIAKLTEPNFSRQYVYKKYAHRKFLKASMYAIHWAKSHLSDDVAGAEDMQLCL
ncbi:hypothetical protein C0993_010629 [Termitomyces sp. T159_Od127]|nr:hypothetical protein C0993_010629 [Termitomyces sp. T159_Od127]